MTIHVDVTWYGCSGCHTIWPEDGVDCCDPLPCICGAAYCEEHGVGHDEAMPSYVIKGATLTYYDDLPDDGAWHPTITKYTCDLASGPLDDWLTTGERRGWGMRFQPLKNHVIRRAAWLVTFDDERVDSMAVCHSCGERWFGVKP